MSSMDDLQIGAGTPAIMPEFDKATNGEKMSDEGCPNLPEINLNEAAPIIHQTGKSPDCPPITHPPAVVKQLNDVKHFSLMEIRPFLKSINARLTRQRYSDTPLLTYLADIRPASLASAYVRFYNAHPFHKEVCAGAKHHHWWKGGLEDHLREMIGIGFDIMDLYPGDFTFSKTDLTIAVFLHDFGKVWTYRFITDEDRAKNPKRFKDNQIFTYTDGQFNILDAENRILLELSRHGITPTDEQWSAVIFAEGGFSAAMYDFAGRSETGNTVFAKNHLATFVSVLDQWSAQILGRSIV